MYAVFENLLKKKNVKVADVAKATGIRNGVFTDWKMGRYTPKSDKLQKIADYFGVSLEYLTTGEEPEDRPNYYLNEDAKDLAQFLFENPEYKVLFDASRKVKKEDIQFIKEMIDRARR